MKDWELTDHGNSITLTRAWHTIQKSDGMILIQNGTAFRYGVEPITKRSIMRIKSGEHAGRAVYCWPNVLDE